MPLREFKTSEAKSCNWQSRLREESRKLTGPRRAILQVLEEQARPLTNKEIFHYLPSRECDLATIYRSMPLLERLGLVKRFDLGEGVARYALLAEGCSGHQHHLVCTQCRRMVEVGDCIVRELEARVAAASRFVGVTHRLEFFGICPACQK